MQNLEFARDLHNQFKNFASEEDRLKKRTAKKEAIERSKTETARLSNILTIQKILGGLKDAKADFKKGENGAIKLSKEQLDEFDELVKMNNSALNLDETDKGTLVFADHLINLAEGKPKKIGKTTYKNLSELIKVVKKSGYSFVIAESVVEKIEAPASKSPNKKNNAANNNASMTNGKNSSFFEKRDINIISFDHTSLWLLLNMERKNN